jgi:DNA-binding CsgD family transcriptional regulator
MAPYQECIHGAAAGLSHAAADAIDGMLVLPPCHFHPEPGSALLREHAWAWRDARGAIALLTAVADPGRRDAARQDAQLTQLARNAHAALAECMIKKLMPEAAAPITPRERQVLIWTAEGKSVPEISCILGIAESTVSFHVRNVIAKLRASNRAHAAVKAALLGML